MSNGRAVDQEATYEIRVKGHLDETWSDWFDGLTITPLAGNETLLTGPVADQPALHGMLRKINDLGLVLIYVEQIAGERGSEE